MTDQKEINLYVGHHYAWRCWRTRRLLRRKGYHFDVVDATADAELRAWLRHFTGRRTLPYVFVDRRPVGGFDEVKALAHSGELESLVKGRV